jgi:hypothetical protein
LDDLTLEGNCQGSRCIETGTTPNQEIDLQAPAITWHRKPQIEFFEVRILSLAGTRNGKAFQWQMVTSRGKLGRQAAPDWPSPAPCLKAGQAAAKQASDFAQTKMNGALTTGLCVSGPAAIASARVLRQIICTSFHGSRENLSIAKKVIKNL